jgi:purine-binding chemotaxis protein CheW
MAKPLVNPNSARVVSSSEKYLTFTLGSETYALPVLKVREIIQLVPMTQVPGMPPHVMGVINLRGSVVPILDLRAKFRVSTETYGDRACIIVVQVPASSGGRAFLGAIVDTVEEVVSLHSQDIEPPPDFGGTPDTRYILGVCTSGGSVKTLLDVEKIFVEDVTQALPAAEKTDRLGSGPVVTLLPESH